MKQALVVEDDDKVRKLVSRYLERLGLRVLEAASASAAVTLLKRMTPDLVCLDLILPESSGYEICEQMRADARLSSVPVLVISGRSSPVDRAAAEEAGANDYIVKPLRWESFADSVARLVGPAEIQSS